MLREAGYGHAHAAFARQLNHAGRVHGTWRYDAASVYWWLRGRRPANHVQVTMTEVLSRRLKRRVDVSELGFLAARTPACVPYPTSTVDAVDAAERLWVALANQHGVQTDATFDSSEALRATLAWRYDLPDRPVTRSGRQRVTNGDVQSLRALADHFTDLDRRYGGGSPRFRNLMADLLARQVAPMLRGTYTEAVGRDLMQATAALSGQLAFMSYDAGDHGFAQQHLTIALRFAKTAGDRLHGAHLLANLATQAVYLGHTKDAARLAEAAIDGAGRAPAAVRARLYTAAASAYGRSGEKRACQIALTRAERALDRTGPGSSPCWVNYFGVAHFAGAALKSLSDLGLHAQALRHASAAISLAGQNARTLALHTTVIATAHARAGDVDASCGWGWESAQHVSKVHSARVRQRVREFVGTLRPHQAEAQVKELLVALETAPPPR
ncbi:hypothetical protein [Micromonospora nigra]|uniref:hypothetical protein n=1 Tax=Micromonospora nigra TaxID=145857 RepID=UPI001112CAD9|nr:hypothetical protein [Micromonospora nigra]